MSRVYRMASLNNLEALERWTIENGESNYRRWIFEALVKRTCRKLDFINTLIASIYH